MNPQPLECKSSALPLELRPHMVRSALLGIIANLFHHLTVVANTNLVVSLTSLVMLRGIEPRISGLKGQRVSQFHYSTINKLGSCCHSICPYVLAFGVYPPLPTLFPSMGGKSSALKLRSLLTFCSLQGTHRNLQLTDGIIVFCFIC